MAGTTYAAPPEVQAVADAGITAARTAGAALSLAAIEVAEGILGVRQLTDRHIRLMAADTYEPNTLPGQMMGGQPGQRWARNTIIEQSNGVIQAIVAAAAADEIEALKQATKLKALSSKLAKVDLRYRSKVEGVLAQAMRRAEKHALTKIKVRARNATKAKTAAIEDDLEGGRITPEVQKALSTTDEELLGGTFDDASAEVVDLFKERQAARRRALADAFSDEGLTEEDLEAQWGTSDEQRAVALAAFIALAMFVEARARLQSGATGTEMFDPKGEVPFDTSVPGNIVTGAVKVADGAPVSANNTVDPTNPLEVPNPLVDYGDDQLIAAIDAMVPGGVTPIYTWEVGAPARPFEPHQEIGGSTFGPEDYLDYCGKDPADFPYGTVAYQPGDHTGCQCSLSVEYVPNEA